MTADLLRFALEDARSAAVRVQLAIEKAPPPALSLRLADEYLSKTIRLLERALAAETE